MELNLKNYKYLKTKKYIKTSNYFLIYNSINTKNFIRIDQKLKKLNLKYYKVYNTITKKVLTNSTHKNFKPLINSLVIIVKPINKKINISFKTFSNLHRLFNLVGIKINNRIYSPYFLKDSFQLNYKNDNLLLVQSLKKILLIPHKLNSK